MRAPDAPPTGTVTFLFTDIEGSTHLVHRFGDDWPALLERHRAALRSAFAAHWGWEQGTEGDSFFVVFASAQDAVAAAAAGQRNLAAIDWPVDGRIAVRIGLHTGEGNRSGNDYVGVDVHRAARIGAAGHGGQVLLSSATVALIEGALPSGLNLHDLGEHRLKDLPRADHLFELVIDGLPSAFPPLRTLGGPSLDMPAALSSLDSDLFYAGDDYVGVSLGDKPFIHSFYSSGKLMQNHVERLPFLLDALANADRLAVEKAVVYVNERWPARMSAGFPLRAVLVPRVTAGLVEARISEASPADAFRALAPSTVFQMHTRGQDSLLRARRLLERVPSYVLELGSDMASIPRTISDLVATLGGGR